MVAKIYEAISNAMSEIGSIGKEKKNQQQGFMYRGIDDVMNNLYPVFVKNKVFCVPEVLEQTREERTTKNGGNLIYSILKVKYTFFTDDGSSVSSIVIGEGMDSADKSSNKAMSVAFKYACFQILCIPTEEMKDPDAECHDLKPNNQAAIEEITNQKISSTKATTIKSLIKETNTNESQFLKFYAIESVEAMTNEIFIMAMAALSKKKATTTKKTVPALDI